jgi:diguanylate cyclase (GGDEF)-like protein
MQHDADISILPRWRGTRWLTDPGSDVAPEMRASLIAGLYGTIPIFIGGVLNTVAVSLLIAGRIATLPFLIWAATEIALSLFRLGVLLAGRRAIAEGRSGPTDLYIWLAVLWAGSVGFGTYISIASGDWVSATLACLSAAAMVGGICFRNFGAPRLAATMILLSLGPCAVASVLSGEPILLVVGLQIPFYVYSMTIAAFRMSRLLVTTMQAERDNDHKARHDPLTGLLNRSGLEHQVALWSRGENPQLTLFYLDLDGFKGINDSYGHSAGDRLLAAVAARLKGLVRPGDAVARIGGDEFVIVSASLDRAGAERLGERLVSQISDRAYAIGIRSVTVGVSIGIARSDEGGSLGELLNAADRALYRAKSQGRSRHVMADQLDSPDADNIAYLRRWGALS